MSTPHDLKSLGMPRPEPELSPAARAICRVSLAIAILGLAYGAALDASDRMVIMSRAEFEAVIQDERILAAQEILNATEPEPCPEPTWRDLFQPAPPARKPAPLTM